LAFQTIWYFSELSKDIVDIIEKDLKIFDEKKEESKIGGDYLNTQIRNSKNAWIPTNHWVGGFLWHYVQRANRENFLYDISNIDGENMQYTLYGPDEFYDWHLDEGLSELYKPQACGGRGDPDTVQDFLNASVEQVRKLSVIVQLSDPDEYEGGNVEIIDESGNPYIVPRTRGTVVVFDSRSKHKVHPITKGLRKSLVAWVIGPRWK
jgi:hypothetical protein